MRVLLLAAVLSVTLTACMPRPFSSSRREIVRYGEAGVASKVVMRKMEPNYLIALDNTACEVSYERFRRVREGQRALCDWKRHSLVAGRQGRSADGAAAAPAAADRAADRERVLGAGTTRPTTQSAGRRPRGN
jgi:hypothetical protein